MGDSQTFQGAWSLCCTSFQAHAWELVFALLVRKTLGGMYFEMHKQFISQRAGCEHTDNYREVGWGTRKHFKVHGRSIAHRSKRMHGELVFALLQTTFQAHGRSAASMSKRMH